MDDKTKLKIVGWLLAIFILGCIGCFILAVLRIGLAVMVTLAGILLFLALVFGYLYQRAKAKVLQDRLDRDRPRQ